MFKFLKKKYKISEFRRSNPSTSVDPASPPNFEDPFTGEHLRRSLRPRHHFPQICKKDEMDPREALRQWGNIVQPDWSPQDMKEGDGITSLLRCSGGEIWTPGGVVHRHIPTMRSFSLCTPTISNLSRYTVYQLRYRYFIQNDTIRAKFLSDIVLDRYRPIYHHVADISANI